MERIKEILLEELSSVYCYNCQYYHMDEKEAEEKYSYYGCDNCHRKYMGWRLSEEDAESIAKLILQ